MVADPEYHPGGHVPADLCPICPDAAVSQSGGCVFLVCFVFILSGLSLSSVLK
ncbi:hypothetical protein D3C76_1843650 [compost metagenome]